MAAYERQLRATEKAQQVQQLTAAFDGIMNLHRQGFQPVQRPIAPDPQPVDESAIRIRHEQQALRGIGIFQRAARVQARRAARLAADQEIAAVHAHLAQRRHQWQQHLDQQWAALLANDPEVVVSTLEEAFEDNEAPAAAVGVDGSEVALVVLVPGPEAIPERLPGVTDAGNLSLRKTPRKTQAAFYTQMIAGYVLVTVKEAFTVAPNIASARVVVIRTPALDAGRLRVECLPGHAAHPGAIPRSPLGHC